MKQPVRAFSIGLFTAGIILLAIVLYFEKPQSKTTNISQQEMIASLEKDGMQVLSDEEYISLSVKNNPEEKKEGKTETEEKDKDDEQTEQPNEAEDKQEKEVKTFSLKIEPGLASSSSISSKLEENGIIDSANEFNQYLEENDYSQYVQIGTFDLTSDMTLNEIAETITN
ncbi:hypothetical protein [Virgibacillus necropolis]|uniref:Aminodeoxychorismate lyase n=1 Tax=Virgibacillus necropolis TaxID=163877 RepID=A0A221MC72_9BACI|nr:hypothetical protein [Virgibacillus necropolis]ASN05227.1 hypothetical protein CFK40_09480 [Virgibacillus necropolis]